MPSIKQDLTNRSESLERVYGFNVDSRFLVNRRYQRKLVWSIDETRAFVDSLRQGFPVPLILRLLYQNRIFKANAHVAE